MSLIQKHNWFIHKLNWANFRRCSDGPSILDYEWLSLRPEFFLVPVHHLTADPASTCHIYLDICWAITATLVILLMSSFQSIASICRCLSYYGHYEDFFLPLTNRRWVPPSSIFQLVISHLQKWSSFNPKLNKYLYQKLEKYARTKLNRPLLYEFSRWKMIGILKI